jgi:hypothetical protein
MPQNKHLILAERGRFELPKLLRACRFSSLAPDPQTSLKLLETPSLQGYLHRHATISVRRDQVPSQVLVAENAHGRTFGMPTCKAFCLVLAAGAARGKCPTPVGVTRGVHTPH